MQGLVESARTSVSNVSLPSGFAQAGIIIFLVFLLILVMARITRTYISWYTSGWYIWVILGFLFAVVIEGFFVISGSTVFTSLLGLKSAPKPIQAILDISRAKLIESLDAKDIEVTDETVIRDFEKLDPEKASIVHEQICKPNE